MKNKIKYLFILISLFLFSISLLAQDIPEKPNPPRLVNDYANLLNSQEEEILERRLVNFNDSTSTQIALVIVKSLNGYEPADFAQRVGEKWGVGQKGKNNGLVFLICPSERKLFIAPGYGLEAIIPDATCKLIIENEIKPSFKNNEYYNGIDKGLNVLMALAKKEYPASAYNKKHQPQGRDSQWIGIVIALIIIILSFVFRGLGSRKHYATGGKIPFWTLFWLMMMSNNSGRSGNWRDFSSGSRGFGGGGGSSFGGFGGGSFGGGGAGGSW